MTFYVLLAIVRRYIANVSVTRVCGKAGLRYVLNGSDLAM